MLASFNSKHPHTTLCLTIEYEMTGDEALEIRELERRLDGIGWTEVFKAPPIKDSQEVNYYKPGTDLFGGWTPEERKKNMRQVRGVLRRFGFHNVPHNKLQLEDLL